MEKVVEKNVNAFILLGSFSDLSVLDFSIVNIRCFNLENESDLKNLSDQFSPLLEAYYSLYNITKKDAERCSDDLKYINVLLPVDFDKHVSNDEFYGCIEILKLLYPSDLAVHTIAEFRIDEQRNIDWISSSHYHFLPSGADRYDHFLYYPKDKKHINEINSFIKLYFNKIGNVPFIRIAMDAYINSYLEMPLHMSYVSLCMALEGVVDGTSEILSRIRRTVAIICADNSHVANIIYANIKKIYALRSKIVHGEKYEYKLVKEYHPYLRSLISRMIVQLMYTEFKSATELQEALIFVGFSDRTQIFQTDTISLNIKSYVETLSPL